MSLDVELGSIVSAKEGGVLEDWYMVDWLAVKSNDYADEYEPSEVMISTCIGRVFCMPVSKKQ